MHRRYLKVICILIGVTAILAISCNENPSTDRKEALPGLKEPLIHANKEAVREENQQIDDYIRRHQLAMETTPTGLRYMITHTGIGPKGETGRMVRLDFVVIFLTGDTVYTARTEGPLEFVVGKGQVITGLEEAILLMRVGDRAKFIIPSHLAFGLIGDQKKIRHKATLVYDLEFVSMK